MSTTVVCILDMSSIEMVIICLNPEWSVFLKAFQKPDKMDVILYKIITKLDDLFHR